MNSKTVKRPKKQHRNKLITKIFMPITALFLVLAILILHVLNFLPFIGDQYIGAAQLKVALADGTENWDADYYDLNDISETEAAQRSRELCLKVAEEGFVLLKNENNTLPLANTERISVFGWAFSNPVYGGTGSGSVSAAEAVSPRKGLEDAGFVINDTLQAGYDAWSAETGHTARPGDGGSDFWTLPEMPLTADDVAQAAQFSDTALVWIARHGGEGQDEATNMSSALNGITDTALGYSADKHYLELTDGEEAIIAALEANDAIKNIIVVINSSNPMELGELENDPGVSAILYAAAGGSTGFEAIGEILRGTVNPSGRMTDTFYANFRLDPTWQNFSDPSLYETTGPSVNYYGAEYAYANSKEGTTFGYATFVQYEEGIYLGYRFYETGYALLKESSGQTAADGWYYGWKNSAPISVGSVTDTTDTGVVYPFGYGLSYTDFRWEVIEAAVDGPTTGDISVTVKVTNIGDRAGKDVVELYYSAPYTPGGPEKAAVVLGAYGKTSLLEPGCSEELVLTLAVEDMASYDEKHVNSDGTTGCYILDAGDYALTLRSDAHTVKLSDEISYHVDAAVAYETNETKRQSDFVAATNAFSDDLAERSTSMVDLSRADFGYTPGEGTFPTQATEADRVMSDALRRALSGKTSNMTSIFSGDTMTGTLDPYAEGYINENDVMPTTGADNNIQLIDLRGLDYDDPAWDAYLDQFTIEEMEIMIGQGSFVSRGNTRLGVPNTGDNDGPASLKWSGATGNQTSEGTGDASQAMPSEVVMACTWNVELIEEMGETIGTEGALHGVSGWYAPGLNTHRSPFGGRNFEYFSEDPYLAGTICAAEVSGVASKGIYAYVKHFAVNDQESYRNIGSIGNWQGPSGMMSFLMPMDDVTCSVWLSEQALREIYLRPFEITVKTAKTTEKYIADKNGTVAEREVSACTAVMSSFELIGQTWCGACDGLLTTTLRDEWGFRGTVTTDASGQPYMGTDNMLYNGGDVMLAIGKLYLMDTTKETASGVLQMRRAVKDMCYTKANSAAMNGITPGSTVSYGLTSWQKLAYTLVAVTGALFLLVWGVFIYNMVTKKKTRVIVDGYRTTVVEKRNRKEKGQEQA